MATRFRYGFRYRWSLCSDKIPVEEPAEIIDILFGDRDANLTEDNAAALYSLDCHKVDDE